MFGVVVFPGSNCDYDCYDVAHRLLKQPTQFLWHHNPLPKEFFNNPKSHCIIVPGGFSYGDYLRCGALAAKAPVMKSVSEAATKGVPVLGICNGFQILCETKLLPGALVRNERRKFVDKWVDLKLENKTKWGGGGQMRLPVAHGEGRYYADEGELKSLWDKGQVWLSYVENPNGALDDIAGVSNSAGNVCGLMPHPERAMFDWMGGADGRQILSSLVGSV
jgi:phosphoribosylformylglycinamidine synthase